MSASRIRLLAAAIVASVLTPAAPCWAQAYGAKSVVDNNDLRWFEPVEFDLDGSAPRSRAGWNFSVEKLGWAITGERIEVGAPGIVNPSEQIYLPNPDIAVQSQVNQIALAQGFGRAGNSAADDQLILDQITQLLNVSFTGGTVTTATVIDDTFDDPSAMDGDNPRFFEAPEITPGSGFNAPPLYNVENGIKDAAPDTDFAFGERYEVGYSDGERGWRIGILDGPELNQLKTYGAGRGAEYRSQSITGFADFNPNYGGSPQDLDGDGVLDTPGPTNDIYALGFGSVAVNFEAPEAFFTGFRDYFLNSFPGSGVVFGPINNVTNYGGTEDDFLDGADFDTDLGIGDDINANGVDGFTVFLADLNGDGTIDDDEVAGSFVDYGDIYEFDIFFEEVTVRNVTEMDGIELMLTHRIDTRHKLERGRRDELEFFYGIRYTELRDLFAVNGVGSVLHGIDVAVEIDNQLIGPQIGIEWIRDHGAWDFVVDGRFMFAYNRLDRGLNGIFATGAVPGSLNTPINTRPTTTVIGDRQDEFSPLAELRIEARYKLTKALALTAGYTGMYIDNIERASAAMRWTAPNYSLQNGRSNVFINGFNGGIELRY